VTIGQPSPKSPVVPTERAALQVGQADKFLYSPRSTAMGRNMGQLGQPKARPGGPYTPECERRGGADANSPRRCQLTNFRKRS